MSEPSTTNPTPAPAPETPETGDVRVDAALRHVDGLDDVPVDQHAERLGAAHTGLQEVLRDPDPGPAAQP